MNIILMMKSLSLQAFILSSIALLVIPRSYGSQYASVEIEVPKNYTYFQKKAKEDQKIIPDKAQHATNQNAFFTTVLDHHFQRYLKDNPNSKLHKVKELEKSINEGTTIEKEDFKFKSKLNIAKMEAEVEMDYLLNYRVWFQNQFRVVNAEVNLYKKNNSKLAILYTGNVEESVSVLGQNMTWREDRTTLGFKYSW